MDYRKKIVSIEQLRDNVSKARPRAK